LPKVSFRNSRSRSPCTIRLKPSATAPISSLVTTGQRVSRLPRSTFCMAPCRPCSGAATLLATKVESPIAVNVPTATMKTMNSSMFSTMPDAAAGVAPSNAAARV